MPEERERELKSRRVYRVIAAGLLAAAITACGEKQTDQAAETASIQQTTATETTAATEASTEAASEAAAEASTTAETATAEASTEASTEAATETVEKDPNNPYDLGIQYTDDCVNTLIGADATMQIVVIGDSQFGNYKGYDGLAYQISQYCDANVYNLAIGGTTAAVPLTQGQDLQSWESDGGLGMTYAIVGDVSPDFLQQYSEIDYQRKVFAGCDFSKTDVFVVEYGVNDFMSKIPIDDSANPSKAYRSALQTIIYRLRSTFPDSAIVICGPSYAQFFDNGTYVGDSNTLDYGYGTLYDYSQAAGNLVSTINQGNVSFMNPYVNLGIDASNAKDNLLEDGIHMSPENRKKYAQMLSRVIIRSQGYSIDEGVDPSTVDWKSTKTAQ